MNGVFQVLRLIRSLEADSSVEARAEDVPRVGITIDLHEGDISSDITHAAEWLASVGIRATFLVPSSLFSFPRYQAELAALPGLGHEVGSHCHQHDAAEIEALIDGDRKSLGFLSESKRVFEDFYSRSPRCFRSPGWCTLGPGTLDTLDELGYFVDSSATPQRLCFLSSQPFRDAWTLASRQVRRVRPGLLEMPTSTFLVPAGSPTFLIFRRAVSIGFVSLLLAEAKTLPRRMIVLQFHPDDFNPNSTSGRTCGRLRPVDFWPRRHIGFSFKQFLKSTDRARIAGTTHALVDLVRGLGCGTLSALADAAAADLDEVPSSTAEPPPTPA